MRQPSTSDSSSPAQLPALDPAISLTNPAAEAAAVRGLQWLVASAFLMQSLDSTIVNTAVPAIAGALSVSPLDMRTAMTSYVLTMALFIPASPWLCDRYGTRRVFAAAIGLFSLGSLFCGIATNLHQLVAARVLQGLGGAAMMPVGRAALARRIERPHFVQAMSLVATVGLLGSVLGPLLGGLLVQVASWRLIFLLNIPVGLVGLWMNQRWMPIYRQAQISHFDYRGFILFAAASALLLRASELVADPQRPWLEIGLDAAAAVVLGGLYIWHSRRLAKPVIDLALMRIPSVGISLAGNLFTRLGVSGMYLLLVIFLQVGCGWTPLQAGLMMLPQAIGSMSAKSLVSPLLVRFGYRQVLWGNAILVALILASFGLFNAHTPVWHIVVLMLIYGAFMGVQYTAMNTLIYVDLPPSQAAMASSMGSTAQYLSMSFGIATASVLMSIYLPNHQPAGYVSAFRWTALSLAVLTAVSSLIFGRLKPGIGLGQQSGSSVHSAH